MDVCAEALHRTNEVSGFVNSRCAEVASNQYCAAYCRLKQDITSGGWGLSMVRPSAQRKADSDRAIQACCVVVAYKPFVCRADPMLFDDMLKFVVRWRLCIVIESWIDAMPPSSQDERLTIRCPASASSIVKACEFGVWLFFPRRRCSWAWMTERASSKRPASPWEAACWRVCATSTLSRCMVTCSSGSISG